MNFHVLSSGSDGNSYCAQTDTELLFIDIGVSAAEVKRRLSPLSEGIPISLFVTHEHSDHISGIIPFTRAFNPKIYASAGTACCLERAGVPTEYLCPLTADTLYDMGNFAVIPFNVSHDAAEPFGYKLMTPCGNIGILTDLGHVTPKQLAYMEDVNLLVLEANHDENMLKKGAYPPYLKKRIASHKGHLSNSCAAAVLTALYGSDLSYCLFAHISENNNDYSLLERLGEFCAEQYGIETAVLRKNCYSVHEMPVKNCSQVDKEAVRQ